MPTQPPPGSRNAHARYTHIRNRHAFRSKSQVERIFKRIDVSGDGLLELVEIAEVIGFYQGYKFDEDEVWTGGGDCEGVACSVWRAWRLAMVACGGREGSERVMCGAACLRWRASLVARAWRDVMRSLRCGV